MTELQMAIASGQVSAEQIEAHRVAGDLPIVINAGSARVIFANEPTMPMREPILPLWKAVKADCTRGCGWTECAHLTGTAPQTLRGTIDGATDESMHVWCKVSDVRKVLEDAERYRFIRSDLSIEQGLARTKRGVRKNLMVWWPGVGPVASDGDEAVDAAIDAAIKATS